MNISLSKLALIVLLTAFLAELVLVGVLSLQDTTVPDPVYYLLPATLTALAGVAGAQAENGRQQRQQRAQR